jgi:maltodextrin utilization protein YvdJ
MPEEISDQQFKAEIMEFKAAMLRFVDTANMKFDGLSSDVRTNSYKLDKFEAEFGRIDKRFDIVEDRFAVQGEQLRIIDGRLNDVISKVVEIDKRLMVVEAKLNLMETKLTSLEEEARQIRLEMNELNESAGMHVEFRKEMDHLEVRLFRLEEKLST